MHFVEAFADEMEKISGRLSGFTPTQKGLGWGTMRSEIASDLLKKRKNVQAERSMRHAPAFDPNAERKQKVQSLAQRIKAQQASQAAPQPLPTAVPQPVAPQPVAPQPVAPQPAAASAAPSPTVELRRRTDNASGVKQRVAQFRGHHAMPAASTPTGGGLFDFSKSVFAPAYRSIAKTRAGKAIGSGLLQAGGTARDVATFTAVGKVQDALGRRAAEQEQARNRMATAGL